MDLKTDSKLNKPTEIILKIQTTSSDQQLMTDDKLKSSQTEPLKEQTNGQIGKKDQGNQEEQEEDIQSLIPQGDYRNSSLFYEVANFFSIIPEQYEDTKHKISYIIDWAILKQKSNKMNSILRLLSETSYEIPQPQYGTGETKLANFYKILRLAERRETTKKMWEGYEQDYKQGGLNG